MPAPLCQMTPLMTKSPAALVPVTDRVASTATVELKRAMLGAMVACFEEESPT